MTDTRSPAILAVLGSDELGRLPRSDNMDFLFALASEFDISVDELRRECERRQWEAEREDRMAADWCERRAVA